MLVERSVERESNFRLHRISPPVELQDRLRVVPLMGHPEVFVYQDAEFFLRPFDIFRDHPTAYYALEQGLKDTQRVEQGFRRWGYSTYELPGYAEFSLNGEGFRIAPPIIERYHEPSLGGVEVTVVIDGAHRILNAIREGVNITCIEISNVNPDYLPVPRPLNLGMWVGGINICTEVPVLKRDYRTDGPGRYHNYRDLSFFGSSGVRSTTATPQASSDYAESDGLSA